MTHLGSKNCNQVLLSNIGENLGLEPFFHGERIEHGETMIGPRFHKNCTSDNYPPQICDFRLDKVL